MLKELTRAESGSGASRTSCNVCFSAAIRCIADIQRLPIQRRAISRLDDRSQVPTTRLRTLDRPLLWAPRRLDAVAAEARGLAISRF